MQTAVGVFGGENYTNGISAPPLMVENAADSGRPAISNLNCPPFLAVRDLQGALGTFPIRTHVKHEQSFDQDFLLYTSCKIMVI